MISSYILFARNKDEHSELIFWPNKLLRGCRSGSDQRKQSVQRISVYIIAGFGVFLKIHSSR